MMFILYFFNPFEEKNDFETAETQKEATEKYIGMLKNSFSPMCFKMRWAFYGDLVIEEFEQVYL